MRTFDTVEKVITRETNFKYFCDKCGDEIPYIYDVRDFQLTFAEGKASRSGGYKVGWKVEDLCDDCIEWLKGILTENAVKITKVEVDW